jgi:hypothetical protein
MLTLENEKPIFIFHIGRYELDFNDENSINKVRDNYNDDDCGEICYIRADFEITKDQKVLDKAIKLFPSVNDFNICKKEFEDLDKWFKTDYKIVKKSNNSTGRDEDERIIYGAIEHVVSLIQKYENIPGLMFLGDGNLW